MINEPIDDWLKSTVDANTHDQDMLAKAGDLGQEAIREFEFVRSLGYESYKGSLRGTRGTLWSEAGNSLDRASLLIAMLRASGVPARYRHGTLSKEYAQQLILSMFSTPTNTVGHIPPGTKGEDPANDIQLLSETQDHWWVEAYLPGQGWKDLDPSFADAQLGQIFAVAVAVDGTDRIAEVPDNLRHKVTIKMKVETYEAWPQQEQLQVTYPLSTVFNAVELVGMPITLRHLVNTFDSSTDNGFCECGVFRVIEHTYTPYIQVGHIIIQGKPFDDLISNFPLDRIVLQGSG